MAVKKKKTSNSGKVEQKNMMHPLMYEIMGLILIGIAIVTFFEYGLVGRFLQSASLFLFGNWYISVSFMLIVSALILMVRRAIPNMQNRIILGCAFILGSLTLFSHIALFEQLFNGQAIGSNSVLRETWRILITSGGIEERSHSLGGGIIGAILFACFHILFDSAGAAIASWLMLFIGLILLTGKALVPYLLQKTPEWQTQWKERRAQAKKVKQARKAPQEKEESKASSRRTRKSAKAEAAKQIEENLEAATEVELPVHREPIISAFTQRAVELEAQQQVAEPEDEIVIQTMAEDNVIENTNYQLPAMSILKAPPHVDQSGEFALIQENARKLEQTFQSFGVKATVTQVHLGPAVTEYEVLPDKGVKVSKIVGLQDDLALALAAEDIRIEAPIPGKSAVGIEVPNKEVAIVSLREVLEAKENNQPDAKLLIGLGRDITGEAKLAQLNKMPHLLVAGSTGSGKSVCINGIIVSILMRAKPHEVKLMMIDPKMVELNVYNGIPHLLAPVVTDARKASQALKKVVSEMERRYDLFSHTGTRNIEGYNKHVDAFNAENDEKHPKLPFIVVIVDELADLMMVASSDVEDSITRLAQMARAAGIHLIIATQRPSVDVITGVIKANIPSRIAFAVSSSIDSRTILDMGGAERLLGRGDMLFLPAGQSKPVRVQGAFLSDNEVGDIVDFVISQQKAQYQEEMIPTEEDELQSLDDTDDLYEEAVQLVLDQDTASVSYLQRKLKVGYARAARIMDQMEERGVVGPAEKSKPRQVLMGK
ncbi:DNA translocase FtsK [Viridibacillus sp. YIM B01967]|uniref:DNA translocase FtsK n=1 Tax=Viridibacillus soli TaxID=2798301 RepID=A0ABS1H4J0_9BACL|nr:DNA translocase FtsK [Viridibacillus soli]MBK3494332.1 DNA translocase FtsK [Viridibacillus soli]